MIFNTFLVLLVFGFICIGNGCLIFFLWWIIGQPSAVDRDTAQYVEGRILSSIGRNICDWYMQYAQREEQRILDMVIDGDHQTEQDRQDAYYELSRTKRKPNPAKAFGVCPVCMGTYITLIINITLVVLVGCCMSWTWAASLAVPVIVYGWALSLTALKTIFLTDA